jgi:hypothetical protein
MDMVPKPCFNILGGILCEGCNCVKGEIGVCNRHSKRDVNFLKESRWIILYASRHSKPV